MSATCFVKAGDSPEALLFSSAQEDNRHVLFRKPIMVSMRAEPDGGYSAEKADLNLHLWAETKEELQQSVSEALAFLAERYGNSSGSNFTEGALRLRSLMRVHLGHDPV